MSVPCLRASWWRMWGKRRDLPVLAVRGRSSSHSQRVHCTKSSRLGKPLSWNVSGEKHFCVSLCSQTSSGEETAECSKACWASWKVALSCSWKVICSVVKHPRLSWLGFSLALGGIAICAPAVLSNRGGATSGWEKQSPGKRSVFPVFQRGTFTPSTWAIFANGFQTPESLSVSKTIPSIGELKVEQAVHQG